MNKPLKVTTGTGKGDTKLSAFDAALFDAGIANYNLIHLSSVIPEGYEPMKQKVQLNNEEFGYKMYLVISSQTETERGKEAFAGLGWVLTEDDPKKGLFVEHAGHSYEEVLNLINGSLNTMVTYRKEKFGPIQHEIVGTVCEDKPVCVLVAAVYKTEGWEGK